MPISNRQNAQVPLACRFAPAWGIALMLVLAAGACSRDPQSLKAKHQARGDAYAAEKKFAEAAIEYRNAVQAVPQDGDGSSQARGNALGRRRVLQERR